MIHCIKLEKQVILLSMQELLAKMLLFVSSVHICRNFELNRLLRVDVLYSIQY